MSLTGVCAQPEREYSKSFIHRARVYSQQIERQNKLERERQQARQSRIREKLQQDLADSTPAFSEPENLPLEQVARYIFSMLAMRFPFCDQKALHEVSSSFCAWCLPLVRIRSQNLSALTMYVAVASLPNMTDWCWAEMSTSDICWVILLKWNQNSRLILAAVAIICWADVRMC